MGRIRALFIEIFKAINSVSLVLKDEICNSSSYSYVESEKTKSEAIETLSQMGFKMGDIESERCVDTLKIEVTNR